MGTVFPEHDEYNANNYLETVSLQIILMSQKRVFLPAGSLGHIHVTDTEIVKVLTTALISAGSDCCYFVLYVAFFIYNTVFHYFHLINIHTHICEYAIYIYII